MRLSKQKRFLAVVLAAVSVICCLTPAVYAVDLSESDQNKIDSYKEQQNELNEKIKAAEEKLSSLKSDINKQQEYVDELNDQIFNYQDKIDVLDSKISALEDEEATYQAAIDKLDAEIEKEEDDINHNELQQIDLKQEIEDINIELQERLRSIYVNGSSNEVELLLNADSFSSYLIMLELSSSMAKHDSELIDGLKNNIEEIDKLTASHKQMIADLEVKKDEQQKQIDLLEVKKSEIVESRDDLKSSQSKVMTLQSEARTLLNSLDSQSATYKNIMSKYESEIDAFDKKIDAIIAAASKPADTSTSSNFKPKDGFIWPLQYSDAYISSGYGYRRDPGSGTYKLHGGTDSCCYSGTAGKAVSAAADGTVIISTWHSAYGYYVGIDHGNGFVTIYAHNSSLAVSVGQTVKQGQTVAYAGETGYAFGAHCHFEIRVNGTKVDATQYVRPGQ